MLADIILAQYLEPRQKVGQGIFESSYGLGDPLDPFHGVFTYYVSLKDTWM